MIGGGIQKITVEIGGKVAASLATSVRQAQMQVSSFGRNVSRTMNDAAVAGKKGFKGIFDNALWQQAAIGAAAVGAGLGASVREAAKFEAILSDIGKTANVGQTELKTLGNEVLRLSSRNRTNLGPEKLAAGIQDLVAQGLELKDAVASMETLGRVATATNSDLLDVTKTGFQLQNALKIRPTELKATFDALAYAGKQGAFELKDMAQFMPTIAAAAGSMGIEGKKGAIALAAMMQMVRKDAPDAGQAATRMTDAMLKMTAPDAVTRFKKFGVDIEKVLKDAKAKGVNPMEAALSELQRVTGGDVFKLGQIFGDKEAKLGLMSLMKYRKEYEKLKADAGGATAAGTVDKDYQKSIATFQGTLASFQNSAQRLGISVGNALLPPLTRLAEIITPLVEGFASFTAAQPGLATGIVGVVGALAGLVIVLPIIAGVVSAIGTIGAAITGVMAAVPLLAGIGTVFALVVPPIGLAAAAIAGVAALAFVVVRNWRPISAFFANLWNTIVATAQQIGPRLLGIFAPIPTAIIRLFTSSSIGQQIISSIINGLKARAGALFGWITSTVARIRSLVNFGGSAPSPPPGPAAAPAAAEPEGRARGGPVRAGVPYRVGERRPELFVPGMSGAIIPRIAQPVTGAALAALMATSAAPAAAAVTINAPITINAAGGDPAQIRQHVVDAFADIQHQLAASHRVLLND